MERDYRSHPRGAAPWGLVGMLVLLAAVESVVGRHDRDFADGVSANWREAGATARAVRSDVLVFGSSLTKCAVLANVLGDRIGLKAYNLGLFGGSAPSSYFLFRRVLDSGGRPRVVVLDYLEGPLRREDARDRPESVGMRLRQWPELLNPRELAALAWSMRDATFFAETVAARLIPSIKVRQELRTGVRAALIGQNVSYRAVGDLLKTHWRVNRGTHVIAREGAGDEPTEPRADDPPMVVGSPGAFVPNRLAESYLRRFLDLAAARGVTVVWLMPPASVASQALRNRGGTEAYLTGLADTLQARYRNLIVVDGRGARYAAGVFPDGTHLDRLGASTLSLDLAAILAAHLDDPDAAPRRVALPTYRALATRARVEDFRQTSRLPLDGGTVRR